MQVQGPRSKDVIRDLFGDAVADLRYYFCAEAEVDGIPVVVRAPGGPARSATSCTCRTRAAAMTCSSACCRRASRTASGSIAPSEARRIEAGIFNYGSDMRVEDTPLHVSGLEKYVEFDQEQDFLGRGRLAEMARRGPVDRKLVGIDIGGEPMTDEGALNDFWPRVTRRGALGRVTAGAWSPRLERNIGYAWVPIRWEAPGSDVRGRDARAARDPVTVARAPLRRPEQGPPKS